MSTSAPRIMSPLAPENGSKTAMRDKTDTSPSRRIGRIAPVADQAYRRGDRSRAVLASPGEINDVVYDQSSRSHQI